MPDLVITDVEMPDGDGLEVVRILREQVPAVKVIVISANTGKGYEQLTIEEGPPHLFRKRSCLWKFFLKYY